MSLLLRGSILGIAVAALLYPALDWGAGRVVRRMTEPRAARPPGEPATEPSPGDELLRIVQISMWETWRRSSEGRAWEISAERDEEGPWIRKVIETMEPGLGEDEYGFPKVVYDRKETRRRISQDEWNNLLRCIHKDGLLTWHAEPLAGVHQFAGVSIRSGFDRRFGWCGTIGSQPKLARLHRMLKETAQRHENDEETKD